MQNIHIQIAGYGVDGPNMFFTSDPHHGHRNVIRFCDRPYDDVKEMSTSLINNWNSVVGDDDYVFVLGDLFWFNDSHSIKRVLSQLRGKIYIIPGNHDKMESYYRVDDPRIVICSDIVNLFVEETEADGTVKHHQFVLSHYPQTTWTHRDRGAYNLFGHIHSKAGREGLDQDLILHWNQCDVGVDFWNYTPVCWETLKHKFDTQKQFKYKYERLFKIVRQLIKDLF